MSVDSTIAALLDRHGETFAQELGIPVERDEPSPWFRLLVAAQLLSANIDARLGMRAARAFHAAHIDTAKAMAERSDHGRWQVLTDARYLRKERTAGMLGDLAQLCLERYDGDLRKLRAEAEGDVGRARELVLEFKGIGDVGADIFLREAQVAWHELVPYADARVTETAQRLGLPKTGRGLLGHVDGPVEFARLAAALVRCGLAGDEDEVRAAAGGE